MDRSVLGRFAALAEPRGRHRDRTGLVRWMPVLRGTVVRVLAVPVLAMAVAGGAAHAAEGAGDAAGRGRAFVEANCARCHAVGPKGESPNASAPAFRTLHERYPVENLAESLAEGIVTGHPDMPEFELDQDQIDDLLAYLKTLEGKG